MEAARTRIAPSPTGENLHIGNAYTALINYVFARQNHGQFIVRIEDTDRMRLVGGSETRILESLSWLGLKPDESPLKGGKYGPYRQSERLSIYQKYAKDLISKGHAYYCFCTSECLNTMRKDQEVKNQPPMYDGRCKTLDIKEAQQRVKNGETYVIRLKIPETGQTSFHDLIRGDIVFENKLIDDQVLLKSDGYPTYHLGVVIDDHLMEISHIIRGEEWISSTPKHIILYRALGWQPPIYAHMPLLRNSDKSKLSKRKNPVWVSWYRKQGFLPEALRNYLATMAWAYPGGREIFTTEEMTKEFKLEDVQTTAPIFDQEKLRWMNGEYLRQKSDAELTELLFSYYINVLTREHEPLVQKILPLVKERIKTLGEFWNLAGFFFEKPQEFERPLNVQLVKALKNTVEKTDWNHEALEKSVRDLAKKLNLKAREAFMELRVAITGKTVGPPLLESFEILGREEILARL